MTRLELDNRLPMILERCRTILQSQAPVRTGNLKASVTLEKKGNTYELYVNTDRAPYMVYTNETWSKGENPNEDWFDDAIQLVIRYLQSELGGLSTKTINREGGE